MTQMIYMPNAKELKDLIFNSVTLNEKLSGEGLEILYERAQALTEEQQMAFFKILQNEKEELQKAAQDRTLIVQEYYEKLKEVKIKANLLLRRQAENNNHQEDSQYLESLISDLNNNKN